MPSVSQGFGDSQVRYSDHRGYSAMQQARDADYFHSTKGASHYPEMAKPYSSQPLVSQPTDGYQPSTNLPSIREMADRRDRQMSRPGGGSSSNDSSMPFPGDHGGYYSSNPMEVDRMSSGSRRSSLYSQHHRGHGSYSSLEADITSSPSDYSRYGQAAYEPSRRSYSSTYGDVDYSSQPTSGSPQAGFGVLGDANDPRSKRRRGNLPKQVTDILRSWFHEHLDHPYPTEEDKQMFIARTGLSISQVCG
jgi:hypothetical protein